MESGLCLYKSKLKSHNGAYDANIGGFHESFAHLTSLTGGAAQLMEIFTSCLLRFSDGERPKIPFNPMTLEEVQLAKTNKELLNQGEDPEEFLAEDGSFDRQGIAQLEDVTDSANCTDKPGMAPTLGVNATVPILTIPIKTTPVRKVETKADRKRRMGNEGDRILTLLLRVMEDIDCHCKLENAKPRVKDSLKKFRDLSSVRGNGSHKKKLGHCPNLR